MIKQGKYGSFNLFYNGILITSYGIHKPNFNDEDAMKTGEDIIRRNKGIPIIKLVKTYSLFCQMIYERKMKKLGIRRNDHKLFANCVLGLLRLGVIKNDDNFGFLICPRKKITRRDRTSVARTTENRPPIHRRD